MGVVLSSISLRIEDVEKIEIPDYELILKKIK